MADELSWKCCSCGLDLGTGTVAGVIFTAYGNYGSAIFDPCPIWQGNPSERLRLVVCDHCMETDAPDGYFRFGYFRFEKRIVDASERWEAVPWQPNAEPEPEPPATKPDDNLRHMVVTSWEAGPADTNTGPGAYTYHSERCPLCGGSGHQANPCAALGGVPGPTCRGCDGRGWVTVPN